MNAVDKIVSKLVEKVENRYYGKYRGFVVDNVDPEKLGRLKVQVPMGSLHFFHNARLVIRRSNESMTVRSCHYFLDKF